MKTLLILLFVPLLFTAQNDSSNYVTKHKMATISFAILDTPKSTVSENPQFQFGLIFKNVIRSGFGIYIYGNKTKFTDEFTNEYTANQDKFDKHVINEKEYAYQKKQLDDKKGKGATLSFINIGLNHNLYYHTKIPLVLSLGANIIYIGGEHSINTKGSVNLDWGFNLFLPSKSRFEVGLLGDFSYHNNLKSYFGICLGVKL